MEPSLIISLGKIGEYNGNFFSPESPTKEKKLHLVGITKRYEFLLWILNQNYHEYHTYYQSYYTCNIFYFTFLRTHDSYTKSVFIVSL